MKRYPYQLMFKEAMVKEMKALMDDEIIEVSLRQKMMDHYQKLRVKGVGSKRKKFVLMWSFKRKCHLEGSLNKDKPRWSTRALSESLEHACSRGFIDVGVDDASAVKTLLITIKVHSIHVSLLTSPN